MPVKGAPERWPLLGLIVPMFDKVFGPLLVNDAPPWHDAQFIVVNRALPSAAVLDSAAALGRRGLGSNALSDLAYAASASRSADSPALVAPKGWLRALKSASAIKPVPAASSRICASKSCTSSKLLLQ